MPSIDTKVKAMGSVKVPVKLPGKITIEVRRADGSLKSSRTQPMHSWTHWFAQWLFSRFSDLGKSIQDTGNNARTIDPNVASTSNNRPIINIDDGVDSDTRGIFIGTGQTAHDFDSDFAVQTIITDANMTRGASTVSRTSGATSFIVSIARAFTNVSGSTIQVSESAIYAEFIYTNDTEGNFMIARDVFSQVAVLNDEVITVTYTITIASPLTRWFGQLLYDFFHTVPTASAVTDTGGTARTSIGTPYNGEDYFNINTAVGNHLKLGTGSTAHDFDADRAIETEIANGTSSGQLSYLNGNVALSTSPTSDQLQILIPVLNVSGGSITVNEVTLYSTFAYTGANEVAFLLCRAVLSTGHAIANGEAALFQVTLEIG